MNDFKNLANDHNFFEEVLILFLPPFFNSSNFENVDQNRNFFLTLDKVMLNKISPNFDSSEKKDILSFLESVRNYDFDNEKIIKVIEENLKERKRFIFVNNPFSLEKLIDISLKIKNYNLKVSKILFSNFNTFEMFEKLTSVFFTCPFCFNSFKKESNFIEERKFLICPFDEKKIPSSFSDKFNKIFNEWYLKNISEIVQSMSEKLKEKNLEAEIVPLIIYENEEIEKFLIDKISKFF